MRPAPGLSVLNHAEAPLLDRLARSAEAVEGVAVDEDGVEKWFAERSAEQEHNTTLIPFSALRSWSFAPATGNLVHESGRFFSVVGVDVEVGHGPVAAWSQPIIRQPEIGLLGIAVREIDGVLHLLMQAKWEPGNPNGVQLSPTVQATKSNYMGVHKGRHVPLLEHFQHVEPHRVLADVLQSEQGAWFYRKRNRNMVIEVGPEVEHSADFCWMTLGQVHRQMRIDHRVNMDARTVLSCLPGPGRPLDDAADGSVHTGLEVLSWITGHQARFDVTTTVVGLSEVAGWYRTESTIEHEQGLYFKVNAVDVAAGSREVSGWTQPMIEPHGTGVVALLVRRFGGVLHALMRARIEPGYVDVIELAPTVQGTPENHEHLDGPVRAQLLGLDAVRASGRILFDAEMSEEGGRFYNARSRYQIIEVGSQYPDQEPPGFAWMSLPQLTRLLQHRHYLNVQARSLIACLRGCTE